MKNKQLTKLSEFTPGQIVKILDSAVKLQKPWWWFGTVTEVTETSVFIKWDETEPPTEYHAPDIKVYEIFATTIAT